MSVISPYFFIWNFLMMAFDLMVYFGEVQGSAQIFESIGWETIFSCHNLKEIKHLIRLRLGLSNLNKQKFKNNFQDTLNLFCTCSCDIENASHFLLYWPIFLAEINTLLNKITNIDIVTSNQADATLT